MLNVLICGINGKMGERFYNSAKKWDLNVVCGVDRVLAGDFNCPVYTNFDEVREDVDAVIDFSSTDMLEDVLKFVTENGCCLIEGTTGYTKKQKEALKEASKAAPIFMSSNMSLGVNFVLKVCLQAALTLANSDIEIIEKHRSNKYDSPSETALILANEINEVLGGNKKIVSGSCNGKRKGDEIFIHSIRGGNIVGEYEILFIGEHEIVSVKHIAEDKELFSEGACKIALFMKNKPNGLYTMKDYFK